jgi:methyl-accepting chemotaxis protein
MNYDQWSILMQQYTQQPQNINEQLQSLKQIQQWLNMNLAMVDSSIQYLNLCANMQDKTNINQTHNAFQTFVNMMQNAAANMQNTANTSKNTSTEQQETSSISNNWLEHMQNMQQNWLKSVSSMYDPNKKNN